MLQKNQNKQYYGFMDFRNLSANALPLFLFFFTLFSFNKSHAQGPSPSPYPFPTAFPIPNGEGLPPCMKTNSLSIHTGVDWMNGNLYANNQPDKYWRIVANPDPNNGSSTGCCLMYQTGCQYIMNSTRAISVVNTGDVLNTPNKYVFGRTFWVDAPVGTNITCSLFLQIVQDDRIMDIEVNGVSLNIQTGLLSACTPPSTWTLPVTVHGGQNDIKIYVRNVTFGGGTSPMYLDVLGSINYAGNDLIFVDNKHYIPNTSDLLGPYNCSPNNTYISKPTFSGTCLATGQSGTVTITNFNANYTYHLYPANVILASNTFTAIGGNTYTVSVDDGKGCILMKTITLGNPALSLSSGNCLVPPATTSINANATLGNAPYEYSINGGAYSPNFIFTGINAGTYTVTVKDASGCTKTSTIQIINTFDATLTSSAACISNTQTATLTAGNNSLNPPVTYSFAPAGGIVLPPNQYVISNPGTYTVTATDAFGCTATSTVTINLNTIPLLTISPVNNVPYCDVTPVQLKATPMTLPANAYTWTGSPTSPLIPTGNPTQVNNNASSTYTVLATDALGCTRTATYSHWANPFCCTDYFYQPNVHLISTSPIYNNGNATGILASFNYPAGNIITTNDHILIHGDVHIDQNITFLNCPNIHFMPASQFVMDNNRTLTITTSYIDAACDTWNGILATNNTQTVIIQNNSRIKDMTGGVRIFGTAAYSAPLLQCSNSQFTRNNISIHFQRTPANYTGFVIGSEFSDALAPSPQFATSGILAFNCIGLTIGTGSGAPNKFYKLKNGIAVIGFNEANTQMINLQNNLFEDILGGEKVNAQFGNIYANSEGCAVYARDLLNSNIMLNIDHTNTNDIHYKNVNKGVVTSHVNTTIRKANTLHVHGCFMNTLTTGRRYRIEQNHIDDSWIGISMTGNELTNSFVRYNTIDMPNYTINWWTTMVPFTMRGIQLIRLNNTHNALYLANNNNINFNFRRNEIGALFLMPGPGVSAVENTISMPNNLGNAGITIQSQCTGIRIENGNGSLLQKNTVSVLGHLAAGFKMIASPNLRLFCNDIDACYGMLSTGNNLTANNNIGNNRLNGDNSAASYGMYFNNLAGTVGTFGDIGTANNDMNNKYYSITPPTRVYKFSSIGCNTYYIRTAATNLIQAYSTGSNAFCFYGVTPVTAAQFWCTPPLNIANYTAIGDIDYSKSVAAGTATYPGFQDVSLAMEQEVLYAILAKDSSLRAAYTEFDDFYGAQSGTAREALYNAYELLSGWEQDSTAMADSAQFAAYLQLCKNAFNAISTTNSEELSRKKMGLAYLWVLEKGTDSLTLVQKSEIETLANSCPFVSGSAVYTARALFAMYQEGLEYDDKLLCDGAYKNGNAYSDDEKAYDELMKLYEKQMSETKKIKLYPNPFSEQLTIEYVQQNNEMGSLDIFDIMGKVLFHTELSGVSNKVSVSLPSFSKGVYLYKYRIDGKMVETGKLIKD